MNSVVKMQSVAKSFRGRFIFSDVNLEIFPGQITAIQGPNGCGKSVLFKLMCGFIRPTSGTVRIDPKYMDSRRRFPKSFGVIIDRPGYVGHLSGIDNLRKLAKIRGEIGDPEIMDAMRKVNLDPGLKQKMSHYSLGMKQKIALAQSFMEGQRVLVLDEPFNALDVDMVTTIRDLLQQFKAQGRTIVFTSHNQEDINALADNAYQITSETVKKIELSV